uniref:Integrase, catalytic region, zinc finger, CCHC-type, peptidase aspartic, catalytic n=1 Tax=Tanacetum cinerariifolium TaxID=118510 RepID=A0A6L2KX59_TANCI|nr:integrase, catalytic region, zinc finger, CCHC-type, peptidase aspartic, catalytic [Tanacetum cinerariifolium]
MPEHQSDIFVIFTVTMEILLEPTSNKLLVGNVGDSIWIELVTLDINLGPEGKLKSFLHLFILKQLIHNPKMVATRNTVVEPVMDDHVQIWVNSQLDTKMERLKDELTIVIQNALSGAGTQTMEIVRHNGEGVGCISVNSSLKLIMFQILIRVQVFNLEAVADDFDTCYEDTAIMSPKEEDHEEATGEIIDTHNFLDIDNAKQLGCQLSSTFPLQVDIASGVKLTSEFIYKKFTWQIHGQEFVIDVILLPLGGCDMGKKVALRGESTSEECVVVIHGFVCIPFYFLKHDINCYFRRKYTVLAVSQIVHCASSLSFLTAVCLIRQSDLRNKPLPVSFLGSGLVFLLHSGLPSLSSSDTRPPMLDRTDFASWQQRIHLYCRGKENGVNILKSIDEGPFHMGMFRETLAEEKDRYNADIRPTNILLQGLLKVIYTLINHYTDAKDIWDNVKMLLKGSELAKEDRKSQLYDDFEHFRQHKGETIHDYYVWFAKLINDMRNIKMTMSRMQLNSKFVNNMLPEWGRFVTAVKLNRGLRDSNYDQLNQATVQDGMVVVHNIQGRQNRGQGNNARGVDKLLLMQAQENRVALDEEQLLFIAGGQDNVVDEDVDEKPVQDLALNVDNVFQADDYDAFDFDVDEAPTAQTMFMENLSSAYSVYDEVSLPYDSNILSEVHDHDHYQDAVCKHHEVHEMHDDVQPNYVVDSHADYTSDSNMILYDQYVKDNAVPVVQNMKAVKEKVEYKLYKQDQSLQTVHMLCKPKTYYDEQNKKQLTLEQIFWSKDLLKMKEKALKEQTIASRPIKALTVYPPNTPATLVSRRITPTGLTEGEKGFEQTKDCYLTEVIPFFKTLKDHFEGIQKALTKETKEMKEIFKELEAEVDQNVMHRKHDEIEWKNLLIANDNLIIDCLSKDVFHTTIDYVLTVSRLSDMHEALNAAQKLFAELESKNSNLQNKIQNDDHDVMGVISRVYYVEGLRHNLFSVRTFCDSNLEVAFRKHSCYAQDTDGVELIKGSRGSNLYTISVEYMMKSSPICLLSKASKNNHGYGIVV